jgi:transposase
LDGAIIMSDEMRVGLHSQVRRRWCPVGMKLVQPQQMRFDHRWLVLGLDVTRLKLRWRWQANLRQDSMLATVHAWQQHPDGLDAVVWDNAPAHKTKAVRTAIAGTSTGTGGAVIFQPPYAPELNPVERIFEYLRDHIEGELYATIEAKIERVEQILHALADDADALRRLVDWRWIKDNVQALSLFSTP